jgi:hypothetical protein
MPLETYNLAEGNHKRQTVAPVWSMSCKPLLSLVDESLHIIRKLQGVTFTEYSVHLRMLDAASIDKLLDLPHVELHVNTPRPSHVHRNEYVYASAVAGPQMRMESIQCNTHDHTPSKRPVEHAVQARGA